jgi:hypothetical protein
VLVEEVAATPVGELARYALALGGAVALAEEPRALRFELRDLAVEAPLQDRRNLLLQAAVVPGLALQLRARSREGVARAGRAVEQVAVAIAR